MQKNYKKIFITFGLFLSCFLFAANVNASGPAGMNVPGINYYTPSLMFVDAQKTSGTMFTYDVGPSGGAWNSEKMAYVTVDENGWPLEIPQIVEGVGQNVRFMLNAYYSGEYVILYDGEGTIEVNGAPNSLINGVRHITFPGATSQINVWIHLTSSTLGNHIRNMRIIPVEYLGNESNMPVFRDDFMLGLEPFHALRIMDPVNTNNSVHSLWADRPKTTSATQGTSKGMAWEHVIQMCNQLHEDCWISIPHKADDNYIQNLAQLFHDTLDPDLKVYVEYSNEIWNWQFQQAGYVLNNAPGHPNTYVSADLLALGAAGINHPEKDAYMMARTFKIFNTVWSDRRDKLVNVATGQHAWVDNSRRILYYLFETDGVGADALSVGGYFGFDSADHEIWNAMDPADVTPEMILQSAENYFPTHSAQWTRASAAYANQYGVDYLVYEGGQHMQPYNQGVWAYNQAVWNAQIHPGMYDLYMDNFALHQEPEVDCKLFMAFSYVSLRESQWGSWGHLENLNQLNSPETLMVTAPKYQALLDYNTLRQDDISPASPIGLSVL